jgi:hypothetical protein
MKPTLARVRPTGRPAEQSTSGEEEESPEPAISRAG